jgi:phage/plasmid-like protein (TIGR03299 family)
MHGVDTSTGKALLLYNVKNGIPWHTLGEGIDGEFTVAIAKERMPELFFGLDGKPIFIEGPDGPVKVPGYKVITRDDTGAILGLTSTSYREFEPEPFFQFGEALTGEGAHLDVIGSLYNGRVVFATFTFSDDEAKRLFDFDPSPFFRHLVASTGNDGRHAARAKNTETRVLCANTYNGHLRGAGREFVIRHTSQMEARVEDAKRALGMADKHHEAFVAQMTDLSKRDVNWASVEAYLAKMFPIADENDGKNHTRVLNARSAVADIYRGADNLDGLDMTAYRLFQATVEYADHVRLYGNDKTRDEARTLAVIDGAAVDLKDRALALLRTA